MGPSASVRVLLVEDNRDDARLIIDLLDDAKRARFIVDVAETAPKGLEKIKKNRYDVLLLDYRLPGKTGMELMQDFQDLHFSIPVILMTSHGDRRLQERALDAGVAEFLEKGTFSADLLERTCLYAIGLHDRQAASGETGGVGMLIHELVALTREGVTAQTKSADQISELRSDLRDEISELRSDLKDEIGSLERKVDDVVKKFTKTPWDRIRDTANWTTQHPVATLMIFLAIITIVALIVVLIQTVDPSNIKALKKAVSSLPLGVPCGTV